MTDHVPVMLFEVLKALDKCSPSLVIDATLGPGGHTKAILERFASCRVIGFDQDSYAREAARSNLACYASRIEIEADNFRNLGKLASRAGWNGADAILFDLGVSNLQLTDGSRGFSFQNDGPLDMRMDNSGGGTRIVAKDILDKYSVRELTEIFRDYGEEKFAFRIAKGIAEYRDRGGSLKTTEELVELIRSILPAPVQRKMGGHPARRVFQALRIAVNDEMNALDEALAASVGLLRMNGRIVVISYHSLEDRRVKRYFRLWRDENLGEATPKKVLLPTEAEIERNYKSRSAKLRIFAKTAAKRGRCVFKDAL